MENNTIDIDDESSECEELILKSRIIGYESENESDLKSSSPPAQIKLNIPSPQEISNIL